ncbi:MAG: type II toxin-antitoxin system VapC family toxin [Candidatus Dormibacteraceae bacterium]
MRLALLDTGPVVGFLSATDNHHLSTISAFQASQSVGRTFCTTWEVIGEAYTLIRTRRTSKRSSNQALMVIRWATDNAIKILSATEVDRYRTVQILEKHEDLRLSYVDGLILALAERHQVEELITADARHFSAVHLAYGVLITIV